MQPTMAVLATAVFAFPDCDGVLAPNRGGPPGVRTYHFNCTTKPDLGAGWTVTQFYARGYIRLQ